jgi:hypothetical protein
MVQTYQPKNVPEVIAAKTGEFWSKTKIDDYYNHFHELLDEPISMKRAMRHFICSLGPDFKTIQNSIET